MNSGFHHCALTGPRPALPVANFAQKAERNDGHGSCFLKVYRQLIRLTELHRKSRVAFGWE